VFGFTTGMHPAFDPSLGTTEVQREESFAFRWRTVTVSAHIRADERGGDCVQRGMARGVLHFGLHLQPE